MKETLSFTIENSLNAVVPVSLLGNNADANDNAGATTEYGWDITGFTGTTENTLQLFWRGVNEVSFNQVEVQLQGNTTQALIDTLNTLNLGLFFIRQVGGQTLISNLNQQIVFGALNIFDNTSPYTSILLFDFYQTSQYSNGSTSVADLSGNGNNGTPVLGTGNGTPTTLVGYNTAPFGFLNLNSSSIGTQFSVRIPDVCKFQGLSPYTLLTWFTNTDTTFGSDIFQGLISAEGRSPLFIPIGYSFFIRKVAGVFALGHTRWNLATNTNTQNLLTWGVDIPLVFAPNTYYLAVAGFDGTNQYLSIYANDTNRYDTSTPSAASLDVSASWGAFLGLRFNSWLNGDVGYAQVFSDWIGFNNIDSIYNATKGRYGY